MTRGCGVYSLAKWDALLQSREEPRTLQAHLVPRLRHLPRPLGDCDADAALLVPRHLRRQTRCGVYLVVRLERVNCQHKLDRWAACSPSSSAVLKPPLKAHPDLQDLLHALPAVQLCSLALPHSSTFGRLTQNCRICCSETSCCHVPSSTCARRGVEWAVQLLSWGRAAVQLLSWGGEAVQLLSSLYSRRRARLDAAFDAACPPGTRLRAHLRLAFVALHTGHSICKHIHLEPGCRRTCGSHSQPETQARSATPMPW